MEVVVRTGLTVHPKLLVGQDLDLTEKTFSSQNVIEAKPGGLDSRDQSRSRSRFLNSLRQGFENVEIKSLDRDSVKN